MQSLGWPAEQGIEIGRRRPARESCKGSAPGHLARGALEGAPSGKGQSGPDRNPAHPEIGELGQGEVGVESGDEDVDRLGRDLFHNHCDFVGRVHARRVKAIRPAAA